MNGEPAATSGDREPPRRRATGDHGYVDRRTAEGVQHERARRGEVSGAADGDAEQPRGDHGGWLQRLKRLFRFGGRATSLVMTTGLLLVACSPADEAVAPAADGTGQPTAEPTGAADGDDAAGATAASVECADGEGDTVVFTDGVPTSQPAAGTTTSDLVTATLAEDELGFRITTNRAEGGPGGGPDATIEIHLQSTAQADESGVVRVRFPDSAGAPLPVAVGPTLGDLAPVETLWSSVTNLEVTAIIAMEDLPVAPPFRWFVATHEGAGAGDVCPDVTGFTADADLPGFPADAGASPEAATAAVTGVDYGYEGLGDQVPSGTRLVFSNASEQEAHEVALVRLTPESPPVDELLQLPPEEGMATTELVGVSIALPGEDGRVTKGDLLLDEPGRYVLLCAIPVGTPPEQLAEHPYGPPPGAPPPDSPPHLARGMVHVIEVTD